MIVSYDAFILKLDVNVKIINTYKSIIKISLINFYCRFIMSMMFIDIKTVDGFYWKYLEKN